MTTINFYIGCNDKDTHTQEMKLFEIEEIIIDTFSLFYDSFSIAHIQGVYKKVFEHTIKVTLIQDEINELDDSNFNDIVTTLKYLLNQECIMVEYLASYNQLV